MNRFAAGILGVLVCIVTGSLRAHAVDPPHYDTNTGSVCVVCHTAQQVLGSTGYNNVCMTCHRPGDPVAGVKPLTLADTANPFNNHTTTGIVKLHQTSHSFTGTDTVPAAGAEPPLLQTDLTANNLRDRTAGALACVRCHNQHLNTNTKFLRAPNDQDQLCLDCHRSRNVTSHLQGSHPVSINYNSAAGSFNKPPINANPANPSSDLSARLTASNGTLLCTTCHGVHFTDSRSSTVDGSTSFANLSSGDGYLLRTDRRGKSVTGGQTDRSNLCTNCHAGKKNHNLKNQDVQCDDCHAAHVQFDPNDPTGSKGTNAFLIRRNVVNVSTSQPAQIFFRYTGSQREYKNTQGTGVCQGCHNVPAPGTNNAPPEHDSTDPRVCNNCHFHGSSNGSFSGACTVCHGYPPIAATIGGPTGLAAPATNALGSAPASAGAHATHVTGRSMKCNACHNGYAGKAMPSGSIDIGFSVNDTNVPGFSSSITTGTFTGTNSLNSGYVWSGATGTTISTATGSSASCSIYCHGATLTGGTTTQPVWTGSAQAVCGTCHGASAASPPQTGGHQRHAGNAAGGLALTCDTCHGTTVAAHMNGTVSWDLSSQGTAAAYRSTVSGSTATAAPSASYGNCSNLYCHSSAQGPGGTGAIAYQAPTWGGASLGCGGCHQNMGPSANPAASGSHSAHAQRAGFSCALCHGSGYTATSAPSGAGSSHVNKSINLSFTTQAAGTTYLKGGVTVTSFAPGSTYGSCSTSLCHGQGTPFWGSTLWSTTDQCATCHSSTAAGAVTVAAPFYSTAYPIKTTATNDVKVGAHTSHVASRASLSSPLTCTVCHGTVTLNSANHMNGSSSFNWSSLATANGSLTPVYTASSGSCANVYCHGASMPGGDISGTNRTPAWKAPFLSATITTAACGSCHGFPPTAASGHPTITIPAGFPTSAAIGPTCSCHPTINPAGNSYATIFLNKTLHINGTLDVATGGSCDTCHGYPPASTGFTGRQNNWSSARVENYPGGGGAHTIANHVSTQAKPGEQFANCVACHDPADHTMSPISFNPSQNIKVRVNPRNRFEPAKQARYTSNRLDGAAHLTGSCSNISCHFGATPKWDPNH